MADNALLRTCTSIGTFPNFLGRELPLMLHLMSDSLRIFGALQQIVNRNFSRNNHQQPTLVHLSILTDWICHVTYHQILAPKEHLPHPGFCNSANQRTGCRVRIRTPVENRSFKHLFSFSFFFFLFVFLFFLSFLLIFLQIIFAAKLLLEGICQARLRECFGVERLRPIPSEYHSAQSVY